MNSRQATVVAQALATGLWATLSLACLTLLVRRTAGQFVPPLPPLVFATWSLSITAWSSAALISWRCCDGNRNQSPPPTSAGVLGHLQQWRWWPEGFSGSLIVIGTLTTIAPAALLAGSGSVAGILLIGGLATILIRATEQHTGAAPDLASSSPASPTEITIATPTQPSSMTSRVKLADEGETAEGEDCDSQTRQTMSRRVAEGTETIEGVCRVQFAETQRDTWLHLAFCPPLADTPELQLEDLEGAGWELKTAAVYPFGARIQIRRALSAPDSGCIAYFAACQTARAA